jgi:tellurite resistance protein TerC
MTLGFEFGALAVLIALLVVDIVRNLRNPHEVKASHAIGWVAFYAVLALIFGGIIWRLYGHEPATEFYSGWLTEYSLSIDNLFVFVLIMNSFKVPKFLQNEALGVGIFFALVLRGIFIAVGGAVVERFTGVFYLFGAFLIYSAIKFLVSQEGETEYHENGIVQFFHKRLPMTEKYNGAKLTVRDSGGKRLFTPMLIVFVSLGVTDMMFAFDSIPAIFGLTRNPFIVFTANIFALMGLRQLYFLLGGLVEKLQYLPLGLSIVLAFIGVNMIIEALHGSGITVIPVVHTIPRLFVILLTVSFTAAASVLKIRRDERRKQLASARASASGDDDGSSDTRRSESEAN